MKYKKILLAVIPLSVFLFIPDYIIQFIALILLLSLVTSFLYSYILYRNIIIKRFNGTRRIYKNEEVTIKIELINRCPLPIFHLLIVDLTGELLSNGEEKKLTGLSPWQAMELEYKVKGKKRGEYPLGPLTLQGTDPLGLFPWKKNCPSKEKVIIYPQVHEVQLKTGNGLPCGNIKTDNPVYEDMTHFKSIREYIPGDDLKRVNWKVSARMGNLYTMQYLPSLYYSAVILLNLNENDYPLRYRFSYIEKAIETAASLIFFCAGERQGVGLLCHGVIGKKEQFLSFPVRKSETHAVELLEVLARVSSFRTDGNVLAPLSMTGRKLPWGCRLMYVGPELDDDGINTMNVMKKKGINPELFYIFDENKSVFTGHNLPVYKIIPDRDNNGNFSLYRRNF